jgi:hypothetical protein
MFVHLQMLCIYLEPITIYATKQEIDQCKYRLGSIRKIEIEEAQTMMEMIKNEYLTNLQEIII